MVVVPTRARRVSVMRPWCQYWGRSMKPISDWEADQIPALPMRRSEVEAEVSFDDEEDDDEGGEEEEGRTMTKSSVPLVGEDIMSSRYLDVSEMSVWGGHDLRLWVNLIPSLVSGVVFDEWSG